MSNISIRPLQDEELIDILFNFQMYAFRASPPFPDKEEWAKIVKERKGVNYHALFEGNGAVAGAASTAMTQNVRGWGNPTPEIQRVMSAMFPAQMPFLHENF